MVFSARRNCRRCNSGGWSESRSMTAVLSVLLLAGLLVLSPNTSTVEAGVEHSDGCWRFANDVLGVTVHEQSGAWDVLDKRCGRLWRQAEPSADKKPTVRVRRITPLTAGVQGVKIEQDYTQQNGEVVSIVVRLQLPAGTADLLCELSGELSAKIDKVCWPLPFVLDAPRGKLVIPQASGLLFGVEELSWDKKHLGGNMSMPWYGAVDLATGQGYAAIFETFDDARFEGARVRGDDRDVLSVQPIFLPQKGTWGYARRLIYHFAEEGGYVALAKRYRAFAKQTGLLKTLAEKREQRPNIDRMVGAVNIYGSHFANIEELRRMGIERAMVSGFSGERVRQMNEWGYLPGRYDIYTDLYETGSYPSKMERCQGFTFPDDVIKQPEQVNQVGWCPITDPKTGQKCPSYVICTPCGLRTLREKMPKRLEVSPFTSYFLDCVTSARLYECYDPAHPMTRTTDREARVKQFEYLSSELGLIVGSETGRDWGAASADYFEGIMSTAAFFANPKAIHEIPFASCEPTPKYEEYGTNPRRRIPLYQLVYGDCMETTWRWGDNTHRMPKLWAQKDLLHLIHASMPTWVLWDPQQSLFWGNRDRFQQCYDLVCRWRRAVGYAEMTNHERLSEDGLVQRSSFANGAAVTVNFATGARVVEQVTLSPRSYLFTGKAAEAEGLPVGEPIQVDDRWEPKPFSLSCNTGFEERPYPWSASQMDLTVQQDVVHSGKYAARLSGTQPSGFSYGSTIKMPLAAKQRYMLRGWLKVDSLEPSEFAPSFKCGVYKDKKWVTNFFTPQYDLSRRGTWQELKCTFTLPDEVTAGQIALEKRTTEPMTATLYIDDVEVIPVGQTPNEGKKAN